MPALNTRDKQSLGHTVTTSWKQDARGITNYVVSRNDLVVGSMLTALRTTQNTPMYHHWGGGPLPYNSFSFEKKEWVDCGGYEMCRQSDGVVNTGAGTRYTYTVSKGNGLGYCISDDLYNYPVSPLTATEIASLDHKANSQVLLQIKDMKINLAQFYAEREQVVRMFTETIEQIAASFRSLKKGDVVAAAEHLGIPVGSRRQRSRVLRRHAKSRARVSADTLSNRWLALQYGWKPLLSDVAGAAETLAKALNDINNYFAHSEATRRVGKKTFRTEHLVDATGRGTADGTMTVEGFHAIKYGVRYRPDSALRPLVELGITNPLELAWELLPYSFVVDWFADVGKSISTLDATVGLTFVSGYKTEIYSWRYEMFGSRRGLWNSLAGRDYQTSTRQKTFVWVKNTRTVLNGFPLAQAPMVKDASKWFTDIHIANALALFHNAFGRKMSDALNHKGYTE